MVSSICPNQETVLGCLWKRWSSLSSSGFTIELFSAPPPIFWCVSEKYSISTSYFVLFSLFIPIRICILYQYGTSCSRSFWHWILLVIDGLIGCSVLGSSMESYLGLIDDKCACLYYDFSFCLSSVYIQLYSQTWLRRSWAKEFQQHHKKIKQNGRRFAFLWTFH